MTSKSSLVIRVIPTYLYFVVLLIMFLFGTSNEIFDFWTPMIEKFTDDLISWFFAGFYVVGLCVLLYLIKIMIIKYSFQGMATIPQSDQWETLQVIFLITNFIIPIFLGFLFSFSIISEPNFQWLMLGWILINIIPDLLLNFYWILVR